MIDRDLYDVFCKFQEELITLNGNIERIVLLLQAQSIASAGILEALMFQLDDNERAEIEELILPTLQSVFGDLL